MLAIGAAAMAAVPVTAAPAGKRTPYYGSIAAAKARMRTGPGRTYPAIWLYQRADLPVKVLDTYDHGNWVKVEDPGGTQGWMLGALVRETRTGFVMGTPVEMLDQPQAGARVRWRAAAGVVGRLSKCTAGWCYFDVHGQGGYVEAIHLWGVEPDETLP
jgi:SH3-like domain-containing protein